MRIVGVLVACAIGIGLVVLFVNGSGAFGGNVPEREDGEGSTLVGRSMLAAKDTKCKSNLDQQRTAIQIATDPVDETPPESLAVTRLGSDFEKCPIGDEAYVYDPATGQVSCPHPGHESY